MPNFSVSMNAPDSEPPHDDRTPKKRPIEPEPSPTTRGLSGEVGEEITFHYRWADLDEESTAAEEDDDNLAGQFLALVVRLDNKLFRTLEPVSMTPFGPYGPSLTLGVVFEAEPFGDGTFRYVRTVERPRVWVRAIEVSRQVIDQDAVRPLLNQVSQLGGKWEWMANKLTIQGVLAESEEDVPSSISELIDILASKLGETESKEGL